MEATRPSVIPVTPGGQPLALAIHVRDSESAPGRMKVALTVATAENEPLCIRVPDGSINMVDAPKEVSGQPLPVCPEFRIEMN